MSDDKFMEGLQKTSDEINGDSNVRLSENGAVMLGTTGSALLDLNFSVPSLRADIASHDPSCEIIHKFGLAWVEDRRLALKWAFYLRDCRFGLGERELFRQLLKSEAIWHTDIIRPLIPNIPVYGRWDDVLTLMGTPLEKDTLRLIGTQLSRDLNAVHLKRNISLLAKWLPSNNTSSKSSRVLANKIARYLKLSPKAYRTILSTLRKQLDVTEVKMSAGKWEELDYSAIPSRANLLYRNAFLLHDRERYQEHITGVLEGKANMNSGVLFPHDIIAQMNNADSSSACYRDLPRPQVNDSLEAMWKSLPNMMNPNSRTLVIADTSRSMYQPISAKSGRVMIIDVAIAMALYVSEHLEGYFKDKIVTFSKLPGLLDLSAISTTAEKLWQVMNSCEAVNTNVEAVFEMVLKTAIDNRLRQEELPENILIISDMEFDHCVQIGDNICPSISQYKQQFEIFTKKFEEHGYKLPRLCFWNVGSRSGAIPMSRNELGCVLISGFSVHLTDMVMSGKLDPYEALVDVLESGRYKAIDIPNE